MILDPFGGVGTLGRLATPGRKIVACELEQLWAAQAPGNGCALSVRGDSRRLPFLSGSFDAVVTSPAYGNRLADCDASQARAGGEGEAKKSDRTRRSYRAFLGQDLHVLNTGALHVDRAGERSAYERMHSYVWAEVYRVLKPGGVFVLNVKDYAPRGVSQQIPEWHYKKIHSMGFCLESAQYVDTGGDQNTRRMAKESSDPILEELTVWRK